MHVLLVKPRGFCAGVNRAIASLDEALARWGPPIYVYHQIVHNTSVVSTFRERGAVFVDTLAEVPSGATLLFSAHGVSPAITSEAATRRIVTINATCPLVERVHRDVVQLTAQGYHIIFIGHRGHDEVEGIIAEAPQHITLVEHQEDVARLTFAAETRLAYLTQTTVAMHDVEDIVRQLRKRFKTLAGPLDGNICFATHNRQEAIRTLAHFADVVLVVGSHNSSNSRRLVEIAKVCGVCAYLVDGPEDISAGWFAGNETVLVTSGASAPESVVQCCVSVLRDRFGATVTERIVREEHVHFPLPQELIQN